jgi:hypothetical protein
MDEIKAIETHYRGRRFRSRLEARWAVFFDFIGIEWDYEPEGFVLPSGACYLPDFQITYPTTHPNQRKYQYWVEVKRDGLKVDDVLIAGAKKVYEFSISQDLGVLYLDGAPDFRAYSVGRRTLAGERWDFYEEEILLWCDDGRPWFCPSNEDTESLRRDTTYANAVTAALSARFELAGEVQVIADVLPGGRLSQLLQQGGIHEPS